ncbi:hypothetical protein YYE_02600 [Plasmodium vinckei vinckei]|nr:hypothetical protein YYE_02600 [Plasmodium vinckei vinckei]
MECNILEDDAYNIRTPNIINKESSTEKNYSEDDKNTSCYVSYSSVGDDGYLDVEYENNQNPKDSQTFNYNDRVYNNKKNTNTKSNNYARGKNTPNYSNGVNYNTNINGDNNGTNNFVNNPNNQVNCNSLMNFYSNESGCLNNENNNAKSCDEDILKDQKNSIDNNQNHDDYKNTNLNQHNKDNVTTSNNNLNARSKKNNEKKNTDGNFLSVLTRFKKSIKDNVIGKNMWNNPNTDNKYTDEDSSKNCMNLQENISQVDKNAEEYNPSNSSNISDGNNLNYVQHEQNTKENKNENSILKINQNDFNNLNISNQKYLYNSTSNLIFYEKNMSNNKITSIDCDTKLSPTSKQILYNKINEYKKNNESKSESNSIIQCNNFKILTEEQNYNDVNYNYILKNKSEDNFESIDIPFSDEKDYFTRKNDANYIRENQYKNSNIHISQNYMECYQNHSSKDDYETDQDNFLNKYYNGELNRKANVLSDDNLLKLLLHYRKNKGFKSPGMEDKIIENLINYKKNKPNNSLEKNLINICSKCIDEMQLSNYPFLCFECLIKQINMRKQKQKQDDICEPENVNDELKSINTYIINFFKQVDKLKLKFKMDDEEIVFMFSELRKCNLWKSEKNVCKIFINIFKNNIVENNDLLESKFLKKFFKENYENFLNNTDKEQLEYILNNGDITYDSDYKAIVDNFSKFNKTKKVKKIFCSDNETDIDTGVDQCKESDFKDEENLNVSNHNYNEEKCKNTKYMFINYLKKGKNISHHIIMCNSDTILNKKKQVIKHIHKIKYICKYFLKIENHYYYSSIFTDSLKLSNKNKSNDIYICKWKYSLKNIIKENILNISNNNEQCEDFTYSSDKYKNYENDIFFINSLISKLINENNKIRALNIISENTPIKRKYYNNEIASPKYEKKRFVSFDQNLILSNYNKDTNYFIENNENIDKMKYTKEINKNNNDKKTKNLYYYEYSDTDKNSVEGNPTENDIISDMLSENNINRKFRDDNESLCDYIECDESDCASEVRKKKRKVINHNINNDYNDNMIVNRNLNKYLTDINRNEYMNRVNIGNKANSYIERRKKIENIISQLPNIITQKVIPPLSMPLNKKWTNLFYELRNNDFVNIQNIDYYKLFMITKSISDIFVNRNDVFDIQNAISSKDIFSANARHNNIANNANTLRNYNNGQIKHKKNNEVIELYIPNFWRTAKSVNEIKSISTGNSDDFYFKLLVHPRGNSNEDNYLSIYLEVIKQDFYPPDWVFPNVRFQLTVHNFKSKKNSISSWAYWSFTNNSLSRGWQKMISHSKINKSSGFLDDNGGLLIKGKAERSFKTLWSKSIQYTPQYIWSYIPEKLFADFESDIFLQFLFKKYFFETCSCQNANNNNNYNILNNKNIYENSLEEDVLAHIKNYMYNRYAIDIYNFSLFWSPEFIKKFLANDSKKFDKYQDSFYANVKHIIENTFLKTNKEVILPNDYENYHTQDTQNDQTENAEDDKNEYNTISIYDSLIKQNNLKDLKTISHDESQKRKTFLNFDFCIDDRKHVLSLTNYIVPIVESFNDNDNLTILVNCLYNIELFRMVILKYNVNLYNRLLRKYIRKKKNEKIFKFNYIMNKYLIGEDNLAYDILYRIKDYNKKSKKNIYLYDHDEFKKTILFKLESIYDRVRYFLVYLDDKVKNLINISLHNNIFVDGNPKYTDHTYAFFNIGNIININSIKSYKIEESNSYILDLNKYIEYINKIITVLNININHISKKGFSINYMCNADKIKVSIYNINSNIEEVNVIIANIEHADNITLLKNQDGNMATPTNNTDNVKTEMKSGTTVSGNNGAQNVNKNMFEKDEQYNIKHYLKSVEPNLIDDPDELKNISYRYCNEMKSFNMFEYFRKNNKNVIIALQRIFICMQMYSLVLCAKKGKEYFEKNMSSNFDQSFFKEKENSNVFCDCKKKYYQNKYDIPENYKKKENGNLYPNCCESLQKNSFTSTIATAVEGTRPNIIPSNTTIANDLRNTEGNTLFYQNYNNLYNNENEPAINRSENNTVPPVFVNNIQREEKNLMINGKDTIYINNKNNMNNCINCTECRNEINFFNYNNSKELNDEHIKYFSNLDVDKKMCLYYYKSTLFYNNVYSEDNQDNYSFNSNQNNRLTSIDSTGKSSSDEIYNSNNMPYYTLNIYNKEDNYLNLFKPLLPNIKPLLFSLNKILFNQYKSNEPINTIHEQLFNHIVCDIAKDKIKLNRKIKEIKKLYFSNNANHNLCKCTNYSKQENNKNCNNTDCIRNLKRYKKAKLKIKHLMDDLKHIRTFEKLCYELFNLKNKSETETYSSDINKCDMTSDYNECQNFNSNNDNSNYTSLKSSPKNKTEKNQKECNMLTPNRDENKNSNNNIDSSGGAGESSGNAGTIGTPNNNNISGLRKELDNNYLNKNKNIDDLIHTMINKKKKSFYKNFITCEKDIYKTIEKSSFTEIPYVLFFYMNCFKNLKRGELIDIPLYLDIYEDKEDDEIISNTKNGKDRNKNAQNVTHNNYNNVKEEKGPYYFGIKKNIRKKCRNDDYNEEDIITYHLYALVISENKDINNMSMPNYNKLNDLELNTINDFNFNSYSYLILRPYIKGPWYKIYKNRITKLTQKCEFNEWKCHKDFYCSSCIYISENYYDSHNSQFLKLYNIKDVNFPLYIHTLKEFDIEEKDIFDFNKQINTDINTLLLDKNHEKIDDELVYELRKMENITPPKTINTQISNQNKIIPKINNKFENEVPKQTDDIYDRENEQNMSKSNEKDIDNVCSSSIENDNTHINRSYYSPYIKDEQDLVMNCLNVHHKIMINVKEELFEDIIKINNNNNLCYTSFNDKKAKMGIVLNKNTSRLKYNRHFYDLKNIVRAYKKFEDDADYPSNSPNNNMASELKKISDISKGFFLSDNVMSIYETCQKNWKPYQKPSEFFYCARKGISPIKKHKTNEFKIKVTENKTMNTNENNSPINDKLNSKEISQNEEINGNTNKILKYNYNKLVKVYRRRYIEHRYKISYINEKISFKALNKYSCITKDKRKYTRIPISYDIQKYRNKYSTKKRCRNINNGLGTSLTNSTYFALENLININIPNKNFNNLDKNVRLCINNPFNIELNNIFYNFFRDKINMNNVKKNYFKNEEKLESHKYYIKTCLNMFKSFFHEYFYINITNNNELKKKKKNTYKNFCIALSDIFFNNLSFNTEEDCDNFDYIQGGVAVYGFYSDRFKKLKILLKKIFMYLNIIFRIIKYIQLKKLLFNENFDIHTCKIHDVFFFNFLYFFYNKYSKDCQEKYIKKLCTRFSVNTKEINSTIKNKVPRSKSLDLDFLKFYENLFLETEGENIKKNDQPGKKENNMSTKFTSKKIGRLNSEKKGLESLFSFCTCITDDEKKNKFFETQNHNIYCVFRYISFNLNEDIKYLKNKNNDFNQKMNYIKNNGNEKKISILSDNNNVNSYINNILNSENNMKPKQLEVFISNLLNKKKKTCILCYCIRRYYLRFLKKLQKNLTFDIIDKQINYIFDNNYLGVIDLYNKNIVGQNNNVYSNKRSHYNNKYQTCNCSSIFNYVNQDTIEACITYLLHNLWKYYVCDILSIPNELEQFYDSLIKKNKKKKNKNAKDDKGANFIKYLKDETKNNSTNKQFSNSDMNDSLVYNDEDTNEKNVHNNLLLSNFQFIDITDIKKKMSSLPLPQTSTNIEFVANSKTSALTPKITPLNNVGANKKNYTPNNKSSNPQNSNNSEQYNKESINFYVIDLSILKEEELNEYKKTYGNNKLHLKEILKTKLENIELKKLLHHFNFTHINGSLINNYISKKNKQNIIICETFKSFNKQYLDPTDHDTSPVNPLHVQENINYIKNCEKSAEEIKKMEYLLSIESAQNENTAIPNNTSNNGSKGVNNEISKKGKKGSKNEQSDDKNSKKKTKGYSVSHQKEGQKSNDKIYSILEEKFETILNNANSDEKLIYNFYQGLQLLNDQLTNKSTEKYVSETDDVDPNLVHKNMITTTVNTVSETIKKYNINNINGIKSILIKNGYDLRKCYTGIDLIFLFLSKIKGVNINFMNEDNYTNNQNIYEIILNKMSDINYENITREYQCLDYILQTFEYIDEAYIYTKYKDFFDFTDSIFTLQNLSIDQNTDIAYDLFNMFFDILNNLFCYGIGIVNNFTENNKEIIKVSKLESFFDEIHKFVGSSLIIDNSFVATKELYTFIQYNSYFWYILYKQYDMFLSYYDQKNHCQIFNAFLFHFLNYVFNFPMDNFFKIDNKLSNQNELLIKSIFKKCSFLENNKDIYLFKIIFAFLLQDQNHFYNYYYSTEMSLFIFNAIMSLNNFYFNMNKSHLFSSNFTKLNNYEYNKKPENLTDSYTPVSKDDEESTDNSEVSQDIENIKKTTQEQNENTYETEEEEECYEEENNNLMYILNNIENDLENMKSVINFHSSKNTIYFNNTIENLSVIINNDKNNNNLVKYQNSNIINNNMYSIAYNNPIININPEYNDLLTIYLTSLYNYNENFRNINNLFYIYSNFFYNFHNMFLFINKKNDLFYSFFKIRFKNHNSKELEDLIISFDKLCNSNKTEMSYDDIRGGYNPLENKSNKKGGTTYIYLNNQNTEKKIKNYEYAIHNCVSEFFYIYDDIVYDINATGNISYYFKEDNVYLYFDNDKDIAYYQERENHFFKINAIERNKIDDIDKRVEKVLKYQKLNKLKNDSIDLNPNTKDSSNLYKNKNNNKRKKNDKNENYYQESELEKDLMNIQFKKNDVIEKYFPYFFYLSPSMYNNNNLSNISLNTNTPSDQIQNSSNSIDSPSNINNIYMGDTSNNNYITNTNEENDNEHNIKYNNYINSIESNIGKFDKIDMIENMGINNNEQKIDHINDRNLDSSNANKKTNSTRVGIKGNNCIPGDITKKYFYISILFNIDFFNVRGIHIENTIISDRTFLISKVIKDTKGRLLTVKVFHIYNIFSKMIELYYASKENNKKEENFLNDFDYKSDDEFYYKVKMNPSYFFLLYAIKKDYDKKNKNKLIFMNVNSDLETYIEDKKDNHYKTDLTILLIPISPQTIFGKPNANLTLFNDSDYPLVTFKFMTEIYELVCIGIIICQSKLFLQDYILNWFIPKVKERKLIKEDSDIKLEDINVYEESELYCLERIRKFSCSIKKILKKHNGTIVIQVNKCINTNKINIKCIEHTKLNKNFFCSICKSNYICVCHKNKKQELRRKMNYLKCHDALYKTVKKKHNEINNDKNKSEDIEIDTLSDSSQYERSTVISSHNEKDKINEEINIQQNNFEDKSDTYKAEKTFYTLCEHIDILNELNPYEQSYRSSNSSILCISSDSSISNISEDDNNCIDEIENTCSYYINNISKKNIPDNAINYDVYKLNTTNVPMEFPYKNSLTTTHENVDPRKINYLSRTNDKEKNDIEEIILHEFNKLGKDDRQNVGELLKSKDSNNTPNNNISKNKEEKKNIPINDSVVQTTDQSNTPDKVSKNKKKKKKMKKKINKKMMIRQKKQTYLTNQIT